ncbi:MAG: NFACT RNA binding domain-containing protein [Cytophagaceae bacterium]|jgi:predicted ribosome quality control (RQC) complex YloA/Tae2 family protein|nr:NFACT RNA binding domain-containing protein [Cytophagaceae bacterium]
MHNHYFVLAKVSQELNNLLKGATFSEAYSHEKNELILEFRLGEEYFFLKVFLFPAFQSFYVSKEFSKARGQVFHCFQDAWNKKVQEVDVVSFDRCLRIRLEAEHTILLKMYGKRSNCLLFRPGKNNELYHRHFASDASLHPEAMDGMKLPDSDSFNPEKPFDRFPLFPAAVEAALSSQWKQSSQTYTQFLQLLDQLSHSDFFVGGNPPELSLFPNKEYKSYSSALDALQEFNRLYLGEFFFTTTKQKLLQPLLQQKIRLQKYLEQLEKRKQALTEKIPYAHLADILMAHLHEIPGGCQEITLLNFYTNQNVTIKLKKELSPQKNAENFYRKGKNEKKEWEELEALWESKQLALQETETSILELQAISDWPALRKRNKQQLKTEEEEKILPYKKTVFLGWEIRIGKNARSNDELTQRHAHKEDLWLHARDAAGSHVILKYQSGKTFPKLVIERAAQLAAWYSKRKTESMCPVIVTPKKFVRKKKGAPEGSVIVEREEVLLVSPKGLSEDAG